VGQGGLGVLFVAREFVGGDAAVCGVEFAVRKIVEVLDDGLVETGDEASGAEVVVMNEVGGTAGVLGRGSLHALRLKSGHPQASETDNAVTDNLGTGIELPGRATRQELTSPAQLNHRTVTD
jgi:hypothetical protein